MSVKNKETKQLLLNLETLLHHAISNIHKEQNILKSSSKQVGGAKKKRKSPKSEVN